MGLSSGPEGSLYIADSSNYRVRRLSPEGTIETVAGAGYGAPAGDGGPAVEAKVGRASSVAAGWDGSLYLAEEASVIRRVGRTGGIRDFARKHGDWCWIPSEDADLTSCGIGQPAAAAEFELPRGGLAGGPDGSLRELDVRV